MEPLIPQNTGSIARMTAATACKLHLIEPLGFELSDKYLKRAGLDYWPETDITVHPNWPAFLETTGYRREQLWFVTTKGTTPYHSVSFSADDALVFGNESMGFRQEFHETYADRRLRIPMDNPRVRSLNLSNAVSIVLYEARRQLGM
jgi:tRNA (cytidine/uridine-2'-O-)-methyltransferase